MPLFHFNVQDGRSLPDQDGTELPDVHAARREASIMAGAMIEDDAKQLRLGNEWHMEVTDEAGSLLFRLDFNIVEGPTEKVRSRAGSPCS